MCWQSVVSATYGLGESPFWHPHEQTLYWVDIAARQVLRANIYMGTVESWDMPSEPGCIAPAVGGGLVIALRHGVFRGRQWGGALEHIVTLDYDPRTVRANDGKCDALGRLWVGTYDEAKTHRQAALYVVDCRDGGAPRVERKADGALTGNGLAWSPDQQTLYWADTSGYVVYAWDHDLASSCLSAKREFLRFDSKPSGWTFPQTGYGGRPDGAWVDVQGHYHVAMYEGSRVCEFAPDGTLVSATVTSAQCPTMVCFGGEDGCTQFLTTARKGATPQALEAFPQSGGVFSRRVNVAGLPVNFFNDE